MARTGKIARLPFELRTQVNQLIRDGASAAHVIKFIEEKKSAGTTRADGTAIEIPNATNVTNWIEGDGVTSGYKDWLKEQERLADMAAKREFAMQIVRENAGSQLHEATLHLAASQLYETLTDFDLSALKELLAEKPENYAAIVNSLAKLSKGALDLQKYRDIVAEQKRKIEAALNEGRTKGGISEETLEKIERELKLL